MRNVKILYLRAKRVIINEIKTLSKAQLSAFIGGTVDYAVMIYLTDFLKIHFTISIIISGFVGATVNFTLNRFWSFREKGKEYLDPLKYQIIKFVPIVLNSVILKSFITYIIVNDMSIDYKIARLITDTIISIGVNYPLQRIWVFKKKSAIKN